MAGDSFQLIRTLYFLHANTLKTLPASPISILLAMFALLGITQAKEESPAVIGTKKPNIILIMADDLGYGDLSCYNPDSRIPTPHIDNLAHHGMRFTDTHSADSVCTPSRYGLLTGRYCWRTPLKKSVLFNYEPPLIEKDQLTLASLLKENGYRTALAGKWHLGLGFTAKPGKSVDFDAPLPWAPGPLPDQIVSESIDFSVPVFGGPEELGFDEAFYTAGCSTDQEPYCFIQNGRFLNMDGATYRKPAGSWRSGMTAPDWDNKTVDLAFTEWALQFMEQAHKRDAEQPFFVFLAPSSPHSPHVTAHFALGKSEAGVRGDMVWLVDWAVGQVAAKLDALGLKNETLLIVTSDNGPLPGSLKPGAPEGTAQITNGHRSAGELRGQKGRVWEGGHRVPFIACWPEQIPAGTVNGESLCLTDMLTTVANLIGAEVPEGIGEDSFNRLPALLGEPMKPRPAIVHHSSTAFALRKGKWKIIFGQGEKRVKPADGKGYLFDVENDPGETTDLWQQYPEIVRTLTKEFQSIHDHAIYPSP
ncbi:MAG: arylsulfatase [Verrucomicrobiota bacterium]